MRRRRADAEGAGGEGGWQPSEGEGEWWAVRALSKDRRLERLASGRAGRRTGVYGGAAHVAPLCLA